MQSIIFKINNAIKILDFKTLTNKDTSKLSLHHISMSNLDDVLLQYINNTRYILRSE